MANSTTPLPMACAWGPLGIITLHEGQTLWGAEFELRGATGFYAQIRHRGIAGIETTLEIGADVRFSTEPDPELVIYSCEHTQPQELEPYCETIAATFRELCHQHLARGI